MCTEEWTLGDRTMARVRNVGDSLGGSRQFMGTFHTDVVSLRPQPRNKVCVNRLECGLPYTDTLQRVR